MKKVMTVIVAAALAMTSVQAMAMSREEMFQQMQQAIDTGYQKSQQQHFQQLELALMREARAPYTPPKYYKTNYSNTTKQKTVTQKQQQYKKIAKKNQTEKLS